MVIFGTLNNKTVPNVLLIALLVSSMQTNALHAKMECI